MSTATREPNDHTSALAAPDAERLFAGPGEVRAAARALDWASTPLGPVEGWAPTLCAAVRTIFESPVGICLWCGPEYTLIYNDAYRRIIGAKHPAAFGSAGPAVWAEIWPELAPAFETVRVDGAAVYAEDTPFVVERLGGAGGEEMWVTYGLSPLRDADGTMLAVLNTALETTGRVRAQRALTGLLEGAPAVMGVFSGPDHVITYVNPTWERVVGKPGALGRPFRDVFPEMAGTGLFEQLDRVYATAEPYTASERPLPIQRWPGGPVETSYWDFVLQPQTPLHVSTAPAQRSSDVLDILCHAIEVTAQVRARQDVEAARHRLEAVLGSINDAFYALDASFRFTYVNARAEALWGLRREDLLGRHYATVFPQAAGSESYRMHQQVMSARRSARFETRSSMIGRWIEASLAPEAGGGLSCVFRDITARKEEEAEREQLLADAQEAGRLKSEFLATMSHEFRTPLNAIVGYAQLLDMGVLGPVAPAQHAHLERLQASARHLLELVDDVLDIAKVDADRLEVRRDTLVTGAAIASAVALVHPQATAKGVRLLDLGASGPGVPYVGDEHRVRQILVNLLANAVKFTPAGGEITVGCDSVADPAPGMWRDGEPLPASASGWACVRVRDTGPGIAPELRARLFEPFVQGDGALTRTHGGTGLGLAISRRLARLMGGDLVLESEPGEGATFALWLPAPHAGTVTEAADAGGERRDLGTPARRTPTGIAAIPSPTADAGGNGAPLDGGAYAVLHALGTRLAADAETVAERYVAALRADARFPGARELPAVQLRDHSAPVVGLLATHLMIIGETHGAAPELLGDGVHVQRVMAELHGAQRYRLGWSDADITREMPLLRLEVERALQDMVDTATTRAPLVQGGAADAATDTRAQDARVRAALTYATDIIRHVLELATRTAVGSYRVARAADAP